MGTTETYCQIDTREHNMKLTHLVIGFFGILSFLPLQAQMLEDVGTKTVRQSAYYHLEPSLDELLTKDEMKHATHLDSALLNVLHNYLLEKSSDFDLRNQEMLLGGRFGEVCSVVQNKAVVDFTVKGDLHSFLEKLELVPDLEILASASTPTYHIVSALVPVPQLLTAMEFPEIRFAHSATCYTNAAQLLEKGKTRSQGIADNQAETELDVDDLRRIFTTVDGTGIKVGTLSDSVDQFSGGISDSQGSGDLPDDDHILVLNDFEDPNATDEGRAMMEHIYDIAPDLDTMGFATAFGGQATFAANITSLGAAGMDIINDDVVYSGEPIFEDGVIARAVNDYVNDGGIYFSCNANYGNLSYEHTFSDSNGNNYHEFAVGDEMNPLTLAAGSPAHPTRVTLGLQWGQPWGGATTDLSFEFYTWDGSDWDLQYSSPENNIGGDPIDIITITNTGAAVDYQVMIRRVSGSINNLIFKYILFANGAWQAELPDYPQDATGTLSPHAGTSLSIAIGAAPFYNRGTAEDFSGRGPHKRIINSSGNIISPYTFTKPDFIAVDRCNTTFFTQDIPEDDDALPNFGGTSASTPNAAAVGALMLELAGGPGSLNASSLRKAMRISAVDLGAEGHDTTYGYGRVQALGAGVASLGPLTPEYYIYLNQFGDGRLSAILSSNPDIDKFKFATNASGATVIDLYEIHATMDPMMVLFNLFGDSLVDVDYDSGPGDDARLSFNSIPAFPYLVEVLSEEHFSNTANFDIIVDAPDQIVTHRTAFLNGNGDDLNYSDSLIVIGDTDYIDYTAPASGSLTVELQPLDFYGYMRMFNDDGDYLTSKSVSTGLTGHMEHYVEAGETYTVLVTSWIYGGNGSYVFSADFFMIPPDIFNRWRKPASSLCSHFAPNVLTYVSYISNKGCSKNQD
jgi:hypothetical protein